MALSPYIANADNAGQPTDLDQGGVAARELRALKQKVNELQTSVRPIVAAGTANALTAAGLPSTLVVNRIYYVVASLENTGAVTLTPGSGTAIPVRQADGVSEMLPGQIQPGTVLQLQYTGTALRQISAGDVQTTPRQFAFTGLQSAVQIGENTWLVTWTGGFLPPYNTHIAIFHNIYYDGTDYRYAVAGEDSVILRWIQGSYAIVYPGSGDADAIIPAENLEPKSAMTPSHYSGHIWAKGYIIEEATLTGITGLALANVATEDLQHDAEYKFISPIAIYGVEVLGESYEAPTLNGLPIFMHLYGTGRQFYTTGPVLHNVIQDGGEYTVRFRKTLSYPDGCFILQPPEGGFDIWDKFEISGGGPISTTPTVVRSIYNGFAATVTGYNFSGTNSVAFIIDNGGVTPGYPVLGDYVPSTVSPIVNSPLARSLKLYHEYITSETVEGISRQSPTLLGLYNYSLRKRPTGTSKEFEIYVSTSFAIPAVAVPNPQHILINFRC